MTIQGDERGSAGAGSVGPPGGPTGEDELVVSPLPGAPSPALLALPAALTAVLSLLLLWSGGPAAGLGSWLLAGAFPIMVGAVTHHPGYAALPAAIWGGWLLVVELAPRDAGLAHTPLPLAITLAAVGVGATLLAQRAIAPALERAAWLPPPPRAVPTIDEALEHEPQLDEDVEIDDGLAAALAVDGPIDEELLTPVAEQEPDEELFPPVAEPGAGEELVTTAGADAIGDDGDAETEPTEQTDGEPPGGVVGPPLPAATVAGQRDDGGHRGSGR